MQIQVIEENAITYYKGLACLLGGEFFEQDQLVWFTTGRQSLPRFNGVLRTAVTPAENLGSVVEPVLDHFLTGNLPFSWVDWPMTCSPGIGKYLSSKGIPFANFRMPAMTRSLSNLPPMHVPQGVEIAKVHTLQDQAEWLDVLMEGFEEPEQARSDFQEYLTGSLSEPQPVFQHFLAHWHGQPCAIATLLRAEQSTGIYHVATLPQYRGNGLGQVITLATMQAAQEIGYSLAVLFATPAGYPLYQHLGFETISSADLYAWGGREQELE